MALLSKDAIFSTPARKHVEIEVPEWGGSVRLQSLTGRERDDFEASTVKMRAGRQESNMDNFRARFSALCIVDEQGTRMFRTRADIDMLGNTSVSALQRIFNKCQEMNGMTDDDVEELTESFEETPTESSTSD